MAYAETRTRTSRAGISAAFLINGLMVTGIVLSVPDVSPIKIVHTTLLDILKPEPRETVPVERRKAPSAKPVAQPPAELPQASTDTATLTTSTLRGAEGSGPSIEPALPQLPPIHDPVVSPARINPRYANALQPIYPPGMIRAEREGFATVRVLIGTDGRVKRVEPVNASDPEFLDATRKQAVSKWRFLPATRDGEAIESWREMTVRFQLPE